MRLLVFFDLPVKTKAQRRTATRFRNFLLKDGYHMVQYSVYARVCTGTDSVGTHRDRLQKALPKSGAVRMMVVTERQFNAIEILVGPKSVYDKPQTDEQLMNF
jgi:CRISPR-associated protein Cas2